MIRVYDIATRVDTLAVGRFINNDTGPVQLNMWLRGLRVWRGAINDVGVDTGRMRSLIEINRGRDFLGRYIEIVSNDPNTIMHHEGTREHTIMPNKHKVVRFSKTGGTVFAHSVLHPGTRPNRFLTDNLRRAV